MLGILLLTLAFICLYILSRIFIQKLYIVLYRITRDREDASKILGWIFIPGTFIHEISHFLTALFLLVPVGKLNLMPKITDEGVNLGSVAIGKTDFLRASLIGLAPFVSGSALMIWGVASAFSMDLLHLWWFDLILIYCIFEITHTMFSSSRDLYSVLELVVFLLVISGALIYFRIYTLFSFIFSLIQTYSKFMEFLSFILFIPIFLELMFLFFVRKVRI